MDFESRKQFVGTRFKELRLQKSMGAEELSKNLGLKSRGSIYDFESGRTAPSMEVLIKMTEVFQVSADYLLGINSNDRDFNNYLRSLDSSIKTWWEEDLHIGYVENISFSTYGPITVDFTICLTPDAKIKTRSEWEISPVDSSGFEHLLDSPYNKKKIHALILEKFPSAHIKKINIQYHNEQNDYFIFNFLICIEDYKDIVVNTILAD